MNGIEDFLFLYDYNNTSTLEAKKKKIVQFSLFIINLFCVFVGSREKKNIYTTVYF